MEVPIGANPAKNREASGLAAQLSVGGDHVGLNGGADRRWLYRLGERGIGDTEFRGQPLQVLVGIPADDIQGFADLGSSRESGAAFGLDDHVPEGEVRLLRRGDAGWTLNQVVEVPAVILEHAQESGGDASSRLLEVGGDGRSVEAQAVISKFVQSVKDRKRVGRRRRRLRQTVSAPGESGLHPGRRL